MRCDGVSEQTQWGEDTALRHSIDPTLILSAKFVIFLSFTCFLSATVQLFLNNTSMRKWRSLYKLKYTFLSTIAAVTWTARGHTEKEDSASFTEQCLGQSIAFITLEGIICVTVTDLSSFNSDNRHLAKDVQKDVWPLPCLCCETLGT